MQRPASIPITEQLRQFAADVAEEHGAIDRCDALWSVPFLLLEHGGNMTHWVPVLVVGLVVVCVTGYLLLEQKFRTPNQKSNRTRRPF